MTFNKENTVGLVIDMQEKLLPHMYNNEEVKNNSIKIIKGLKALDIPIIFTQQYTKGLGETIPEISEIVEEFSYIEKSAFSCYREKNFLDTLNSIGKKNVVIVGIESHVCVLQTALDLTDNNFNPIIVTNAIGSRKPEDKEVSIWRMRNSGSTMTTYESILFELCKKAGTDEFKSISKLVK